MFDRNEPDRDSILACVDALQRTISRLIRNECRIDAILWSLTAIYTSKLSIIGGGGPVALDSVIDGYASLDARSRTDAKYSTAQLRLMITKLEARDYSQLEIAWALIGALIHIQGKIVSDQAASKTYGAKLIEALAMAQRRVLN